MPQPATGPGDVEAKLPSLKNQMLKIKKRRPAQDKDKSPTEADPQSLYLPEKKGDAHAHEGTCAEVSGAPEEEVGNARNDGADPADEIGRGLVDRGVVSESPRGNIPQVEGDKGEQE